MPRGYDLSREFDLDDEVASPETLAGERDARQRADYEALHRKLFDLPPLGGREPLPNDMPDAFYSEWYGHVPEVSPAELQQRYAEYGSLIDRAAGGERSEPAPQQVDPQQLWSAFRQQFPHLSGDPQAVERAAQHIARQHGFSDAQTFISQVARYLQPGDERSEVAGHRSAEMPPSGGRRTSQPASQFGDLSESDDAWLRREREAGGWY